MYRNCRTVTIDSAGRIAVRVGGGGAAPGANQDRDLDTGHGDTTGAMDSWAGPDLPNPLPGATFGIASKTEGAAARLGRFLQQSDAVSPAS